MHGIWFATISTCLSLAFAVQLQGLYRFASWSRGPTTARESWEGCGVWAHPAKGQIRSRTLRDSIYLGSKTSHDEDDDAPLPIWLVSAGTSRCEVATISCETIRHEPRVWGSGRNGCTICCGLMPWDELANERGPYTFSSMYLFV